MGAIICSPSGFNDLTVIFRWITFWAIWKAVNTERSGNIQEDVSSRLRPGLMDACHAPYFSSLLWFYNVLFWRFHVIQKVMKNAVPFHGCGQSVVLHHPYPVQKFLIVRLMVSNHVPTYLTGEMQPCLMHGFYNFNGRVFDVRSRKFQLLHTDGPTIAFYTKMCVRGEMYIVSFQKVPLLGWADFL